MSNAPQDTERVAFTQIQRAKAARATSLVMLVVACCWVASTGLVVSDRLLAKGQSYRWWANVPLGRIFRHPRTSV